MRAASVLALWLVVAGSGFAADPIVRLGAGSYTTALPDGAKGPPPTIWKTPALTGKVPTNSWCSSLAWMKYSERHYPHPLAVEATAKGLRVFFADKITANTTGIFGAMPPKVLDDLVLGHTGQDEFPDARVDGF